MKTTPLWKDHILGICYYLDFQVSFLYLRHFCHETWKSISWSRARINVNLRFASWISKSFFTAFAKYFTTHVHLQHFSNYIKSSWIHPQWNHSLFDPFTDSHDLKSYRSEIPSSVRWQPSYRRIHLILRGLRRNLGMMFVSLVAVFSGEVFMLRLRFFSHYIMWSWLESMKSMIMYDYWG